MRLGKTKDGQMLTYDPRYYVFRLDGNYADYPYLQELDHAGLILWLSMEQHDWFRKIDNELLESLHMRAQANAGKHEGLTPEEQVQFDAKRDDSILAGKIVDADPALVRAVADAIEEQGLVAGKIQGEVNPLAASDLPMGMEPLSQLLRSEGENRKMTRSEARLMRKILKNDDRQKAKREKQAASIEKEIEADTEENAETPERTQEEPAATVQKPPVQKDPPVSFNPQGRTDEFGVPKKSLIPFLK